MNDLPDGLSVFDGQVIFPESACAICIKEQSILLVRQPRQRQPHPGSLELPGGKVRTNESPTAAALRELREEAGVVARQGDFRCTLDLDLDSSVHQTHLVNATDPVYGTLAGEFPVEWVALDSALPMIERGEITHAPTVAAVLLSLVDRGNA